jgi:hypothetical protein
MLVTLRSLMEIAGSPLFRGKLSLSTIPQRTNACEVRRRHQSCSTATATAFGAYCDAKSHHPCQVEVVLITLLVDVIFFRNERRRCRKLKDFPFRCLETFIRDVLYDIDAVRVFHMPVRWGARHEP